MGTVESKIVFRSEDKEVKRTLNTLKEVRKTLGEIGGSAQSEKVRIAAYKAQAAASREAGKVRAAELRKETALIRDNARLRAGDARKESAAIREAGALRRQEARISAQAQAREQRKAGQASGVSFDDLTNVPSLVGSLMGIVSTWAKANALLVGAATGIGIALGIQAASFKESVLLAAKTYLGSSRQAADFLKEGMDAAMAFGTDVRSTVGAMQKLLASGFSRSSITQLTRGFADLQALNPDANIESIAIRLAQIRATGRLQGDELNELANAGVARNLIYEQIAKAEKKSVAEVIKMQAAGQITPDMVEKALLSGITALTKAPLGEFAKAQAKTLPKLLDRLKAVPSNFFMTMTNFDTGPIKGAIENVLSFFAGPQGKALQEAAGKFLSAVSKAIFGPFEGKDGEKRIKAFGEMAIGALNAFTSAAEKAGPIIAGLIDLFAALDGDGKAGLSKGRGGNGAGSSILSILGPIGLLITTFNQGMAVLSLFGVAWDLAVAGITGAAGAIGSAAAGIGSAIINGITGAVNGGLSAVVSAISNVASSAIGTAKSVLGIASPSREFAKIGWQSVEGFRRPFMANDNGVSEAARGAAQSALGAAGFAAQTQARGAGPTVTYAPVYHIGAGASPETVAGLRAAQEDAQAEWERRADIWLSAEASGF
jgi:tape measure domain-containing protein